MLATAANRTALQARSAGILVQLYGGVGYGIGVATGPITPEVTGLGVGAEGWVRVSTTGRLERVALPNTDDDVVGQCDASGLLHATFGAPGPIGPPAAPTGQGLVGVWQGADGNTPAFFDASFGLPISSDNIALSFSRGTDGVPAATIAEAAGSVELGAQAILVGDGAGGALAMNLNDDVFADLVAQEFRVQRLRGDASGELKSLHQTYNFVNGSGSLVNNVGRCGYAEAATLTATGGAVTQYFDFPDEASAILDIRGVFVRNAARLRRARTYEVTKVAGAITVTAIGSLTDQGTAITGVDIILFAGTAGNAGKLGMTTTPAAAGGTTTQVSKSIDGDLLKRPAT